ncbi:hypothetical protein LPJ77_003090 [Coemansia sp. RSA 2523]|nr:hypothetical protein LPJ77_003090 [Coemansia sp. RSA 2523]
MPDKVKSQQTTAPKRRFQRRPLSAETLQTIYDNNIMGATAGFFCAIWAGWLMGERISSTFTTPSYEDPKTPYHYYFGVKDIALVLLVASKILFARTCIIRYIIRPMLKQRLPLHDFLQQARLATAVYSALVYLLSACAGLWMAYPILARKSELYSSHDSVSAIAKAFIVVQGAMQVSEIVVQFAERPAVLFAKLNAVLTLLVVVAASIQRSVPVAGVAVAAASVLHLVTDVWQIGQIFGGN